MSRMRSGSMPSFFALRAAIMMPRRKPIPIKRPYILMGMGPMTQVSRSMRGISKRMGCMNALRSNSLSFLVFPEKHIDSEQDHANGDRRVSHIEGRPVPGLHVPLDKVHNFAVANAVDHVPYGPAHDERKGDNQEAL